MEKIVHMELPDSCAPMDENEKQLTGGWYSRQNDIVVDQVIKKGVWSDVVYRTKCDLFFNASNVKGPDGEFLPGEIEFGKVKNQEIVTKLTNLSKATIGIGVVGAVGTAAYFIADACGAFGSD